MDVPGGRVGGLLNPPVAVAVRAVELVAGLVPAVLAVAAPRRAAVVVEVVGTRLAVVEAVAADDFVVEVDFAAGDFAGDFTVAADFVAVGDLVALDEASGSGVAAGSAAGAAAGASSCWTTSNPSASDMLGYMGGSSVIIWFRTGDYGFGKPADGTEI